MKLQDFLGTQEKWNFEAIAEDIDLTRQIQVLLMGLGLLDPPADGKFGPVSAAALKEFQELTKSGEKDYLGAVTAKNLIETKPGDLPQPPLKLSSNIASRIIKYLQLKDYQISIGAKQYNIVYIEGMSEDWTLNGDAPNQFNDLRIVIEIVEGVPKIVNHWQATTEPGRHYTHNPMNPKGAARIKFGQYKAWAVGFHGNADRHEALIQVAPITVHRDFDKNFIRTGDKLDTGLFAVNQHWGYDAPANDIKTASAGCLVGRRRDGHREFMSIIKQDRRYLVNKDYVFYTTIIPGDDFVKTVPG
ncbi:peptidoglycan-binding protein [Calothrix sp. FACHB-1219]|uniref:peptidoglycan-binding domain-containing protein n=1 Tax=unclassified Calothrix TaxID=2619626 RepID=UPI001685BC7B|nr:MULTISPECIES: peptidoglycan-binding domain-containing protein [unclassified Calothrix]MBD2201330.1 peptidoglycan-binding protein [Calothrix sp. FACHB-168]MBD2215764.1 peptidoglycan-binding protein [Calothrix sp. FACHB-1219]